MGTVDLIRSGDDQMDQQEAPVVARLRVLVVGVTRLPSERQLAEQLGVTRHRLRQSLMLLRARGDIAAPAPRRRAASFSRQGEALVRGTNPLEVIELRIALEPALARLASVRATPLDLARIERAATTAENVASGAADLAFHRLIAASTGNALAAELYGVLRRVGTDLRLRMAGDRPACPSRLRQRDAEHRAIAAAIAGRDADGAESAMRQHLQAVQRQILDRLAPQAGAA